MSEFDDIFDPQEDIFPYPRKITREYFSKDLQADSQGPNGTIIDIQNVTFNADKFLFEHYRFTLLEDLQKELGSLLKELDHELFNLVNNDYFDFINLGKTLDGGEDLVDKLRLDTTKYKKKLSHETKRLEESEEHVKESLKNINKLDELRRHAKYMLILEDFIEKFELLLSQNQDYIQLDILKQLTSLYLSIHQILKSLPNYQFVAQKIEKVNVLRLEFKSVLDEFLKSITPQSTSYDEVINALGIYSIIGDEREAVRILKDNKR